MSIDGVSHFAPSSPVQLRSGLTLPSNLPSTSDAFQFFPNRPKVSHRPTRSSQLNNIPISSAGDHTTTPSDMDRLRSDAFYELHRSVTESGEGLVSRMRDWEGSLTALSTSYSSHARMETPRGRKHYSSNAEFNWTSDMTEDLDEEEEDDIQIVSGNISSPGTLAHWGPPHKKRALSMSIMEVEHASTEDLPSTFVSPESSERCSSPVDPSISDISTFTSDDDEVSSLGRSFLTPALTSTNSANSSLISLPLPPLSRNHNQSGAFHIPSTASREEKAIAALTLAMANGAAGLNDYADIRVFEGNQSSTIDESLIGEMWH